MKRFEELPITTMTMVMSLSNEVDTQAAFHLLPITKISLSESVSASKCKLPHCEIPGSILSMRYRHHTRGIIRSKSKPFKNSVTMDISTIKKNINLKLSTFSIQMCGASSKSDGLEAAGYVISLLKNVQKMLNKINSDPESATKLLEWVKLKTKGEVVEKSYSLTKQYNNVKLQISRTATYNNIILPEENTFPEDLDHELINFFLSMSSDFMYHQDYCKKLCYIMQLKNVIEEPLEITNVNEVMVNYNFSLGFEVDRALLNQYIDGQQGFISRYNNALVNCVTVELPYEPPSDRTIKSRSGKRHHHSFLIYKSGSCTFSGPGPLLMKEAYDKFLNIISELKPYISFNDNDQDAMVSN